MEHYFTAVEVITVDVKEAASSNYLLVWRFEVADLQVVFYWHVGGAAVVALEVSSLQIAFCLCFHVKGNLLHLCQHYFPEVAWLDPQLQTVAEDWREVCA